MNPVSPWPDPIWTCVDAGQLQAPELLEAAAWCSDEGRPCECWRVNWGRAEPIEICYVPSLRRAGVCWGAPVQWVDAESAIQAFEHYLQART